MTFAMFSRRISGAALAASLLVTCDLAFAGGFLQYEHGAPATGMADARTAFSDDASALYFNPAGICALEGLQVEIGTTGTLPSVHYQAARKPDSDRVYTRASDGRQIQVNDGMNDADSIKRGFFPSHLYVTYNPPGVPLAFGLGVNSPFGLGIAWPGDWDGRFITTESDMATLITQPTVALDVGRLLGFSDYVDLFVAAGYDLVWASARLGQAIDLRMGERYLDWIEPGPEGKMLLTGSAWGHGYNFAVLLRRPGLGAFGASVRSGVRLPFRGTARFSFNEQALDVLGFLGTEIPASTGGSVTIDLPWTANFGIMWEATERLKVALDLYLAFFQSYDELTLHFDCSEQQPPCGLEDETQVYDWHTGWQLSAGIEYNPWSRLVLRAGYAASFSPVPPETLEPSVPDGRQNNISVGAGWRAGRWKLDAGYMLAFWSVTKENEVGGWDELGNPGGKANGVYSTVVHMLAVSFSLKIL
ncbi:MAG: hypothetical protein D6806_09670 [Deltaproteobacteria bacterium]|nr:MAG: hypothetical protein D6806_09670 [Deltaproteobacteria bacterium]